MRTIQNIIETISENSEKLRNDFGIQSLRIFGSVARGQQTEDSDIDIFVEMPPKMYFIVGAKQFLEEILGCDVDLVRKHSNISDFLLNQIERDGIDVFSAA